MRPEAEDQLGSARAWARARLGAELRPLQAEVLGLFASQDEWINEDVVRKFDALCEATGKRFSYTFYNADHAFANPSSPRYNSTAATDANATALAFLRNKLR